MRRRGTLEVRSLLVPAFSLIIALVALSLIGVGAACAAPEQPPAFPGAEGFGAQSRGGRRGRVIFVTSLDDRGPGTLREACAAKGPRIVVFRVSGVIDLEERVAIVEPYITIAGQTAPGDGICLRGAKLQISADHVVIRHLRIRLGDGPSVLGRGGTDCLVIVGDDVPSYGYPPIPEHVIIDHCSFSWGIDENVSTAGRPRNVTIQWCISSEALWDSLHGKGPHSMGMLLGSRDNTITVHHCLLAHNFGRNPRMGDTDKGIRGPGVFDIRNNVMYNHGRWSCTEVHGTSHVNYVGNYIKMGPDGEAGSPRGVQFDTDFEKRFFVRDNIWPSRGPGQRDERQVLGMTLGAAWRPPPASFISPTPIPAPPVTTEAAASAYDSVLRFAGATLPVRDVVDARIIEEVRTGVGAIIDTPADVGGYPEYRSAEAPADSDCDGMPDEWERRHGLSPTRLEDGPQDADGDGYTNIEEYLNNTDPNTVTGHGPVRQREPELQQGNEALCFGAARIDRAPEVYDSAARDRFLAAVAESGKEVGDYLGLRFVRLPPGEFAHRQIKVTLTRPIEMAACEITQAQWTAVMGAKPWLNQAYAKDAPENAATYVSWDDCQEFLSRLNDCGARRYRLPTEAEWEFACRAGSNTQSMFWFNEKEMDQFAWHAMNTIKTGQAYAHPVAAKRPDPRGLFDMAGNADEWRQDWFHPRTWSVERSGPTKIDPAGAEPDAYFREYHIRRGGSFCRPPEQIFKLGPFGLPHRPSYRNFDMGFRVVRELP